MQMVKKALRKLWIIKLGIILCFTPLVVFSASFTQNSPGEARDYFGKFSNPSKQQSNPIGGYSYGCLAGGQILLRVVQLGRPCDFLVTETGVTQFYWII